MGTVRTIAHDCGGGGERCLGYLAVALPEEFRTESMWEARIDLGNCVDATLRGGDVSHVRGIAENIIPDIGIIMNCDSPKTVVFRTTLGSTMETVTSQPAYLINTYENDGRYYVMLDYVEWFRGEGQREAMIEDGVCLPPDCYVAPNGHKRNKNPKLRTLPLAQNVAIDVHGYFASFVNKTYSSNENSRLSVEEFFRSSIQAGEKMFYSGTVFELAKSFVVVDVVNGDVTRISEPYQE